MKSDSNTRDFTSIVWGHYDQHARDLPWRTNIETYWILVSEIMLQQTQVSRVIPKFREFVTTFPSITTLAQASFQDVLKVWSGLGYNRRAKFLHQAAQKIVNEYDGDIPRERKELETLPGVGPNTAGAIAVYSFNQPEIFIETNIRSVFLHHFFPGKKDVHDKEIMPLIKQTLPDGNFREWYWALMDYGSYLKKQRPNPSRASKHHTTQTKFEGSDRQLRGRVIHLLLEGPMTKTQLKELISDTRLPKILIDLQKEGMVIIDENHIILT